MFCRSKILRLKQHHKIVNAPGSRPPHRSASCQSNSSTASAPASTTAATTGTAASALPQSASNYSFNKMTSSSSNHSFASGFYFFYPFLQKFSTQKSSKNLCCYPSIRLTERLNGIQSLVFMLIMLPQVYVFLTELCLYML